MKSNKPFFSIIFPIYNREAYLQQALNSIFSQTFKDFELIAIDDGSTDKSLEILQSNQDLRLLIFSQNNLGVSEARNLGISHAQGEYICFADSDDLLHQNYLLDFYHILLKTQADVIKNTHIIKFTQTKDLQNTNFTPKNITPFYPSPETIKVGGTIWSYCIQRNLIIKHGLKFLPSRIMEDEAFIFMTLPLSQKTILFFGSPYFYRQHPNSIVAQSPVAFDRIKNFKDIVMWYKEHNLLDKFPLPFYILYDVSIKNPQYLSYLQEAQIMLKKLNLENFLHQDKLAYFLYSHSVKEFQEEHQKSRGILKYYLKKLFRK